MASLFVSHSSKDDPLVRDLEQWLRANGFTDLFIDHSDIGVGSNWADALRAAAGACRVVILLVTPNWLSSVQCPGEFRAAWYMGKRIVPLYLLPPDLVLTNEAHEELRRVRAENQGLNLTTFVDGSGKLNFSRDEAAADQLRRGLTGAGATTDMGLDPHSFAINRAMRPCPFPGLGTFGDEDADAALFFGRSREIAETLEILRGMRAVPKGKALIILGASGAGKSSLLRAGIVPRLRRETPAWIVLQPFRPGADPLLNLVTAIAGTAAAFGVPNDAGSLKAELLSVTSQVGTPEQQPECASKAVARLAALLRSATGRTEATILVSIDQAEEFLRLPDEACGPVGDLLRIMQGDLSTWQLALTIRADQFAEFQSFAPLRSIETRGYDLRPLPPFRFRDVIEEPARRYGLKIEPELVDAFMEDAPDEDTLPILGFALQRLWEQFAARGTLGLANYHAIGGLSGLIESAAERALFGILPDQGDVPFDPSRIGDDVEALGLRTFIPALADVNDDGLAIKRPASWRSFDTAQRQLLDRFDLWRLVVRRGSNASGGGVEVAHEAIFRSWKRLDRWLLPERSNLVKLRDLKLATLSWTRSDRRADFLVHVGDRLTNAEAIARANRYSNQVGDDEHAYLFACRRAARQGERAARRRQIIAIVSGLLVVFTGLLLRDSARRRDLIEEANTAIRTGNALNGAVYAIAGNPLGSLFPFPSDGRARRLLVEAGLSADLVADLGGSVNESQFSRHGGRLFIQRNDHSGVLYRLVDGYLLVEVKGAGAAAAYELSNDGRWLITDSQDDVLILWDARTGRMVSRLLAIHTFKMMNNLPIATVRSSGGKLFRFDLRQARITGPMPGGNDPARITYASEGAGFVTASPQDQLGIWSVASGQRVGGSDAPGSCKNCSISKDGRTVASMDRSGQLSIFDGLSGVFLRKLERRFEPKYWNFSPGGTRLAGFSSPQEFILWDTTNGRVVVERHDYQVESTKFTDDGRYVIVYNKPDGARVIDTVDGRLTLQIPDGMIDTVQMAAEGRLMARSTDNTARLFDLSMGRLLARLGPSGATMWTDKSDSGRYLVTGGAAAPTSVWSARTGQRVATLSERSEESTIVSDKGDRFIAESAKDDSGAVWSIKTGGQVAHVGGGGSVYDVKMSDDGNRLLTQSRSDRALLWSMPADGEAAAVPLKTIRARVCARDYKLIGATAIALRSNGDTRLFGRPWNPCDWRGLATVEGWAQLGRSMLFNVGIASDYRCNQTSVLLGSGSIMEGVCSQSSQSTSSERGRDPRLVKPAFQEIDLSAAKGHRT